jgi:DNA polymerase-3 subunit epsilon
MRQIVLDTETTGLEPAQGHRIIEIGCVELVNRRTTENRFHQYLQPDRDIDPGAVEVHGITTEFLADKPRFADVAADFMDFIKGAELIIHNAPFDVGFLNSELARLEGGWGKIADHCSVIDTLALARQLHSGQKNNLDALCKRYGIDNSQRQLHGALLDAEILADVYLAMTGGQATLSLDGIAGATRQQNIGVRRLDGARPPLKIIVADAAELQAHAARLAGIDKASGGKCLWKELDDAPAVPE